MPQPADVAQWEIFHANATIWPAVLELCDSARETLELEQYIFAPEGIGAELLDVLTAKARQGVRVRLLVDAFGSGGIHESPAGRAFCGAGGELVLYNRLRDALRNPVSAVHRLHRKSVLCDGEHMMVGGSCYSDRMADWRDTMVRVEGPIARAGVAAFENAWAYATGRTRSAKGSPERDMQERAARWNYVTSEPVRPSRQAIYATLLERIGNARESVSLTTPYFSPDRPMRRALRQALDNGARLRLILPERSDHRAVDIVSRHFARAVAERGVEVHFYEPGMLHAKLAMIDDAWSLVSSFNLDILSISMNVENGLASASRAFHDALMAQYECDIARSRRL